MTRDDLILLLALGLVFAPLEWLWPIRRTRPDWPRLSTDVAHVFISGSLIRWGSAVLLMGLVASLGAWTPGWVSPQVRAQPLWLQYVELLVLSDLGFYLAHRLFHAVPFLWRFHEVHHSSEHLDWIAAYRVHPVDQVLNATIIALPAIVLGFSPEALLIHGLVYRWHSILLHSNVRVNFGPLKWLVASPHFHHWHHADEDWAYDRNFGGQLILFDWLFGTLNLPSGKMPQKYGLSQPIGEGYLAQLAHPFRPVATAATPAARTDPAEA
jgi:sterol desaturase/sphingolipid hydroxylase (fatty acid hydroxylase superfamily)